MKYEVQTKFVYGFENCWTDENDKPLLFSTKKEAEQELKDHIEGWNDDPNTEDEIFYEDFKIVEVKGD